jgi:hypothetical protein
MSHITGHDRSQTLLLSESLDQNVGPENPVRCIVAFVDGLDLTAAGFIRVASKLTGRPEYPRPAPIDHHIYAALRSSISPNRNSRSSTSNATFCASSLSAMLARWALRCCNSTIRSSTVSAAISL